MARKDEREWKEFERALTTSVRFFFFISIQVKIAADTRTPIPKSNPNRNRTITQGTWIPQSPWATGTDDQIQVTSLKESHSKRVQYISEYWFLTETRTIQTGLKENSTWIFSVKSVTIQLSVYQKANINVHVATKEKTKSHRISSLKSNIKWRDLACFTATDRWLKHKTQVRVKLFYKSF